MRNSKKLNRTLPNITGMVLTLTPASGSVPSRPTSAAWGVHGHAMVPVMDMIQHA